MKIIRTFFVLSLLIGISLTASAQVQTVCDCPDVNDLINRLNMAAAAVETYKQEISVIEQAEREKGKSITAADPIESLKAGRLTSDYDLLQGKIGENIAEHQTPGAKLCGGETTTKGDECVSSAKNCGSPCLEETILKHENVHRLACNVYVRSGNAGIIGSRFMDMRLVEVAQEEINAYQEEIKWIHRVLNSLPKQCRPSGWVGFFRSIESKTLTSHQNLPQTPVRSSGSEDTENNFTRTTLIFYRDQSKARVTVEDKNNKTTISDQHWPCESSLGAPKPHHHIHFKTVETSEGHANGSDIASDMSFDYDPADGRYALTMDVPGVTGEMTGSRHEEASGNCDPKQDQPKDDSVAPFSFEYNGTKYYVEGTAQPNANTLSGSKTIEVMPAMSLPGGSMSYTATISWNLVRID